jgi:hypothetical protein
VAGHRYFKCEREGSTVSLVRLGGEIPVDVCCKVVIVLYRCHSVALTCAKASEAISRRYGNSDTQPMLEEAFVLTATSQHVPIQLVMFIVAKTVVTHT